MGYIILGIFALWILWRLGSWLAFRIRDSIEDRAIKKSGIENDFVDAYKKAYSRINPQIQQTKDAVNSFRQLALEKLPGLKDRMARRERQQDYIHFVLPYKSNSKKRRR